MLEAVFWGLAGTGGLLIGAAVALRAQLSPQATGAAIAFTGGALISAFAFELDEKAYELGGGAAATLGLLAGAVLFFAAERMVGRPDAERGTPGFVLAAIPGSVAIAITVVEDADIGGAILAAVFLLNIALSLWATSGLRRAGHSTVPILRLWTTVVVVSGLAAALTYGLLNGASNAVVATTQAAAIGAVLCMLVDTMLPEAFDNRTRSIGLVTIIGFGAGFALSIV